MKNSDIPFNVTLMELTPEKLQRIRPVTAPDIYDGISGNFHENGLFSVLTFGRVGDEQRDTRFGYIDAVVTVFHPTVFRALCQLKALYRDIMSGTRYAIWNAKESDFEAASELEGETGYAFFLTHWHKIKFKETKSPIRTQRVKMIEKYRKVATTSKILVLPAGLRDYVIDSTGRGTQDEINDIYRKILGASKVLVGVDGSELSPIFDNSRKSIQQSFNEIYDTISQMITGKKGFFQEKFGSRRIFNGTRNVISAMDTSVGNLDAKNAPGFNDTMLGLFQVIKGALPVTVYLLRNGWLSEVFGEGGSGTSANLVDQKTLQRDVVELPLDVRDRWVTVEGLEKLVESFRNPTQRFNPIEIEGRYLGLIYIGPDKTFKIFGDIRDLPEHLDRTYVEPLTYVHLLYLCGYKRWNSLKAIVTRYPVAGIGSTYPSHVYCKTTIVGEMRRELGEDWAPLDDEHVALEFPTRNPESFVDSQIVHPSRIAGMKADYDGDTASATIVYSDEAIAELNSFLDSTAAYLDPRGGFKAGCDIDTVKLVMKNMTGA